MKACRRSAALLLLAVALGGCASARLVRGPDESVRPADPDEPTRIDLRLARLTAGRADDLSGFRLLAGGEDALLARLAMANLAERSLDVQSYIWELDTTGRLVLARLIAAADRGVRVRILLDDTGIHGSEAEWLAIDSHPNLSVRVFNPFRSTTRRGLAQALEFVFHFTRLNRRMHNKAYVADGAVAIVGGRNVSDAYFALDPEAGFRDLDLLVVGGAAEATATAFDAYWNSDWAFPVKQKRSRAAVPMELAEFRAGPPSELLKRFPYAVELDPAEQERALDILRPRLSWATSRVLWDRPEKIAEGDGSVPGRELLRLAGAATEEIEAEIAYLILPDAALDLLRELNSRGVEVRILTNSLASNDVVAAHAGYAKVRPEILATGTRLYELQPRGDQGPSRRIARSPRSVSHLHVKAGTIDEELVFVGSLNLDGRSLDHNTEVVIVVESRELALEAKRFFATGFAPTSSWEVRPASEVEPGLAGRRAGGQPIWFQDRGLPSEQIFHEEPRAGRWQRFLAALLRPLPIEGLF